MRPLFARPVSGYTNKLLSHQTALKNVLFDEIRVEDSEQLIQRVRVCEVNP